MGINVNSFSLADYKDSELTIRELLENPEMEIGTVNPKCVNKIFIYHTKLTTTIYNITQIDNKNEYMGDIIHIKESMIMYMRNQHIPSYMAQGKTMTKRRYESLVNQLKEYINTTPQSFQVQEGHLPSCQVSLNKDFVADLTKFDKDTKLCDIYQSIVANNEQNLDILRTEVLRFRKAYLGKTIWRHTTEARWHGLMVKDIFISHDTILFEGFPITIQKEVNLDCDLIKLSEKKIREAFIPQDSCTWAVQDSDDLLNGINTLFKVFKKV